MIKLELNEKNFDIKNQWEELTVEDYKNVTVIAENNSLNDIERSAKMIEVLSELSLKEIFKMPSKEFTEVIKNLEFLNNKIPNRKDVDFLELEDGNKYYIYQDFKDLTVAESISVDIIMSRNDNKLHLAYPELLTVFLRQKDSKGKFEEYDSEFYDRIKMFNKILLLDINNVSNFFLNGKKE